MAGGGILSSGGDHGYPGKMALYVFITCIVSGVAGFIFGYDIGISEKFFTPILFIAAFVAPFIALPVTQKYGRKISMLLGGIVFFIGALINLFVRNNAMLYVGRILLGVGVGFANQSVPVYL